MNFPNANQLDRKSGGNCDFLVAGASENPAAYFWNEAFCVRTFIALVLPSSAGWRSFPKPRFRFSHVPILERRWIQQ